MDPCAQILLFGSLAEEGVEVSPQETYYALEDPLPLEKLLGNLKIDLKCIQLAMVNHRAVDLGHLIRPGDRVALFPPEYPVFSDWKDFRIKAFKDQ